MIGDTAGQRWLFVVNNGIVGSTHISADHGALHWVNDALFMSLGNTLFRVNY